MTPVFRRMFTMVDGKDSKVGVDGRVRIPVSMRRYMPSRVETGVYKAV